MMTSHFYGARVLSIDPCPKGFGFAVFEGSYTLLDWGVARVWGDSDDSFLARIETMIDRYQPALILIEGENARRRTRAKLRLSLVAQLASSRGIALRRVSGWAVRETLRSGRTTKYDIAIALIDVLPELELHLPCERKPWTSEDERMHIFDAVALVWAYLHGAAREGQVSVQLDRAV
jgi:hypothetical protein